MGFVVFVVDLVLEELGPWKDIFFFFLINEFEYFCECILGFYLDKKKILRLVF